LAIPKYGTLVRSLMCLVLDNRIIAHVLHLVCKFNCAFDRVIFLTITALDAAQYVNNKTLKETPLQPISVLRTSVLLTAV